MSVFKVELTSWLSFKKSNDKNCYTRLLFISGMITRGYYSHQSHTFIFYSEGLSFLASSIKHFIISFSIAVMVSELRYPLYFSMGYAYEIFRLSCPRAVLSFVVSFLIRDFKDVSSYVDQIKAEPSWSAGVLFQRSTRVLFFSPYRDIYPFYPT